MFNCGLGYHSARTSVHLFPVLICCFLLQYITGGNKNWKKTTHMSRRQVGVMQSGKETSVFFYTWQQVTERGCRIYDANNSLGKDKKASMCVCVGEERSLTPGPLCVSADSAFEYVIPALQTKPGSPQSEKVNLISAWAKIHAAVYRFTDTANLYFAHVTIKQKLSCCVQCAHTYFKCLWLNIDCFFRVFFFRFCQFFVDM